MNAYELADELWEKYLDNNECQHGYALSSGCPNDDCKEQALYDAANMLRQQADRIAELEKQLDIHFKNGFEAGKLEGWKAHKYHSTPQTKPLSDEEILEMTIWNKNLYELYVEVEKEDMIAFARAIEERHGIK